MSEHERNREITEEAFAAFQAGDIETVNARLDPAIEVKISDALMNSGTWSGVDGFWQSIGSWLEAWDDYKVDLLSIETPDDNHVIAEAHQSAIGRLSGVPVELTTYFLFEIHDGITVR